MNTNNHYYFDNVDTVELAKKYGTPLYIMSESIIRANIEKLKQSFLEKYTNTQVLYASKAFITKAMVEIISDEGIGIDVVSGGEIYTVMKAGFNPENIYFHGNNKSFTELEMAVNYNVGYIVVDNFYELELLEKILKSENKKQKVLLRLSPGLTEIDTHEYIITGQRDTKFGFQIDENLESQVIKNVLNSENIILKGFHFHIGSQLFDKASYLKAFEILFELIKSVKNNFDFITEIVNIGGGFGIPYTKDQEEFDIELVLDAIMGEINNKFKQIDYKRPLIVIEPGRWIVGPAGISIYEVGAIKTIKHIRTYASVDGGMSDNIRPSLYNGKYNADVANKINDEKKHLYTIAGKACESGDILIKDILLPELSPRDYLVVYATGAYGYSMASNYNRHLIPAIVMTNNGSERLIVKRQTYDDLVSREV